MFQDRTDAGNRLAERLAHLLGTDPIVLALPRGGVPVGVEVARLLRAPIDVLVVRKLGVPGQPELAMGAIGEEGVRVLNVDVLRSCAVTDEELERVEARERVELDRRAVAFRGSRPPLSLRDRTVIVVDDGLATGATARAALRVARARGAAHLVLAVPVAPPETLRALALDTDEIVCVEVPGRLYSVGEWYLDFSQTTDGEVVDLLERAHADRASRERAVEIPVAGRSLPGRLVVPPDAEGIVLFAHGSGSSRLSPRNRSVATALERVGLGTLLFDLLDPAEAADRAKVFEIELLAARLAVATAWVMDQPECRGLPVGYFGASTGAAAALVAAARPEARVDAIVSRGGRPDLAAPVLGAVRAPTLLVVGGADLEVLDLNREAAAQLRCEHRIAVVSGATHLFEEPGALETVARLAADWFREHFAVKRPGRSSDARAAG